MVDRADLEKGSVEAVIAVGSINPADEKRNGHIKADDFFVFVKLPTMTFKRTAWRRTVGDTFDALGNLIIKDVTKLEVLKGTLLGFGPGLGGARVCGWESTTTLKKSLSTPAGPAILEKLLATT